MEVELTQADVEKYLNELEPGATAGYSGMSLSCPLAFCINWKYGITGVEVNEDQIIALCSFFAMPDWANRFVQQIDQLEGFNAVTREKAQQIFQECIAQ